MHIFSRAAIGMIGLCLIEPTSAQQPVANSAPVPAPLVVASSAAPVLHIGQEISLRTLVELTTLKKSLAVGQRVPLEVAESVMINGQVVIPVGTPAMGEITTVRNKGMWGKSGAFAGRVIYLRVGDRQIRLSGIFDDKGHAGGGAAVATSAIVFLPAGFFMTGTSAKLPVGTPVKGFLDEDVPVQLASTAPPAPLLAALPTQVGTASNPATDKTATPGTSSSGGAALIPAVATIRKN